MNKQKKISVSDDLPALEYLLSLLDIEIELCSAMLSTGTLFSIPSRPRSRSRLQWTAQISDLVEIIYSLAAQQSINNGQATVKLLVSEFSEIFNINLVNHANIFAMIRNRKSDRAKYLHTLYDTLTAKMEEMDS